MRWVDLRQPPVDGRSPLNHAEFGPDGRWFVTSGEDGIARVWDTRTHRELHTLRHGAHISSMAVDPQGRRIATIGYDVVLVGENVVPVRIWDAESGSELPPLEGAITGNSLQFSRAGDRLLAASRAGIHVWDTRSGRLLVRTRALRGALPVAVFDPTRRLIASADGSETVTIWDAQTGEPLHELKHDSAVGTVCFTETGEEVVTGGKDGRVSIWSVKSGALRMRLGDPADPLFGGVDSLGGVGSLAINPRAPQVVAGTGGGMLAAWDLQSGALL